MDMEGKVPVISDKAASRIIDGEAVIVLLEKRETVILNEVGSRLWEIMDGVKSIGELAKVIISEFDSAYPETLKDVFEFIEDLAKRQAISIKQ